MTTKQKNSDDVYNNNFQELLNKFHKIIKDEPKPEKAKDELIKLKAEVSGKTITFRQADAIWVRCDNYITGMYGSTSKEYEVHARTK